MSPHQSIPLPPPNRLARPVAEAAVPPPSVPVLGVPLALTDYARTLDWIDATVAAGGRGYVCVAATHTVMACQEDPELRAAVLASDLTVPDGQPLVWAMNALGHAQPHRVYGPDLMAHAFERAARTGTRMYLYGGRNQGSLVQLALNLRRRYPGVRSSAATPRRFRSLDAEEVDGIVRDINASGADVVLGRDRRAQAGEVDGRAGSRLDAPVLVGVGAAFDFHAGMVTQAPRLDAVGRARMGLPALARAPPASGGATCATTRAS
jgi:N-acetylglucosaminyldiphosphoundecaprenol N-acetyl-beta-D-mannosaminyltransferase